MKIISYSNIEPTLMDNDVAKGVAARVLIGKADGVSNFCMRLFELSKGGYTPRHSHEWEHEIFVHSGQGAVFSKGEWTDVTAGQAVLIPGNEEHQIKNAGDTTFTFVCLIPSGAPEL